MNDETKTLADRFHPFGSIFRQKMTQKVMGFLWKIGAFVFWYVLLSFAVIAVFYFVFRFQVVKMPDTANLSKSELFRTALKFSLFAYMGKFEAEGAFTTISVIEFWVSRIISVGIIARMAQSIITPGNPIELSSCVCVTQHDGGLKLGIRYWLMKPGGEFMYNVRIRAYLQSPAEKHDVYEENVKTLACWDAEYEMLRGICQWQIDLKDEKGLEDITDDLNDFPERFKDYKLPMLMYQSLCKEEQEYFRLLKKQELSMDSQDDSRCVRKKKAAAAKKALKAVKDQQYDLIVVVRATDESGHRYGAVKSYDPRRFFFGAEFAEIRESKIQEIYVGMQNKNSDGEEKSGKKARKHVKDRKHEGMRYQNFNKAVESSEDLLVPEECEEYLSDYLKDNKGFYLKRNNENHRIVFENSYQARENRAARLISKNKLVEEDWIFARMYNALTKRFYHKDRAKNRAKDWAENQPYLK